ncbi:MAG: hypothetical protein AB7O43_10585 [Hyphomicrobiaceae bacterium]
MIHHVSFGVRDPHRAAHVLAALTHATPVRAPTPPFPSGAWLVVAGDAHGSFLEILPATSVFDPDAPLGIRQRPATFEPVSAHVLVGAAVSAEEIKATADRERWRTEEVETGLFKIIKLWIDGTILVELLAKGEKDRYVAAFGAAGIASLDRKLHDLEVKLAGAFSQKFPPEVMAKALGPDWRKVPA